MGQRIERTTPEDSNHRKLEAKARIGLQPGNGGAYINHVENSNKGRQQIIDEQKDARKSSQNSK
jgi:hypothetical protein